ncbi:MAG: NapC/NirT family cytochrome c [Candidatus Sulfotelmatobacter sp.]
MKSISQAAASRSDETQKPQRPRWVYRGLLGLALIAIGIFLVALTHTTVVWSSSDQFCGTACHSMTWATDAYKRGPHYVNQVGVRVSCGQCHIPYDSSQTTPVEYVKLLWFKADRGARDFWNESHKTIATQDEWEKRRPLLRTTVETYLTSHNYITCRGCHALDSFSGPRSQMKILVHKDVIKADAVDCFQCHRNLGHVYEQGKPKEGGWYTEGQAATGAKTFAQSCAPCHGANFEGGAGPALKGTSWQQLYGGAKLLTVWGEIKGPMAQYAGTTFATQQSLDLLAYLLQQNGLPAGNQPLVDTGELSNTIPSK